MSHTNIKQNKHCDFCWYTNAYKRCDRHRLVPPLGWSGDVWWRAGGQYLNQSVGRVKSHTTRSLPPDTVVCRLCSAPLSPPQKYLGKYCSGHLHWTIVARSTHASFDIYSNYFPMKSYKGCLYKMINIVVLQISRWWSFGDYWYSWLWPR